MSSRTLLPLMLSLVYCDTTPSTTFLSETTATPDATYESTSTLDSTSAPTPPPAPSPRYSVGGKLCFTNVFGGDMDGLVHITPDGLVLDSAKILSAGGYWRPKFSAGGYAQIGKKMYAADASLEGSLRNHLSAGGHSAGGAAADGSTAPLKIQPSVNIERDWTWKPSYTVYTGDDAWRTAQIYGAPPQRV